MKDPRFYKEDAPFMKNTEHVRTSFNFMQDKGVIEVIENKAKCLAKGL